MKPILILEDSAEDVTLIRRALAQTGVCNPTYVVFTVSYAIAYLMSQPPFEDREKFPLPTVVLLDIHLPGISGFDLLSYMPRQAGLSGILTVVVSGDDDPATERSARELGAFAFLHKRYLQSELESLLCASRKHWNVAPARPMLSHHS